MTVYNFQISEKSVNDMSVEDYEAFERAQDGDLKMYRLRPAVARFMVDDKGQPIPHAQALKMTGAMKIGEMREFIRQFFEAMKGAAVPKENGSLSKLPSEAAPADSLSQPG